MFNYLSVAEIGLALHQPEERFKLVGMGTGRKFFTYMQASLPIISTDYAEIARVVDEANCGILIDTTSIHQISNTILYLLNNRNKAKKMGRNSRNAVERKYNWEVESHKLLRVYDKII